MVKSPASQEAVAARDQSWKAFQKAVERRDIAKVASMIEFPLLGLEAMEDLERVGSRETFERDFEALFPKVVIRTLLDYSPSAEEIRSRSWSVSHSEPAEISEEGWAMIYDFVLTPDGKVRLKRIHLVG